MGLGECTLEAMKREERRAKDEEKIKPVHSLFHPPSSPLSSAAQKGCLILPNLRALKSTTSSGIVIIVVVIIISSITTAKRKSKTIGREVQTGDALVNANVWRSSSLYLQICIIGFKSLLGSVLHGACTDTHLPPLFFPLWNTHMYIPASFSFLFSLPIEGKPYALRSRYAGESWHCWWRVHPHPQKSKK